MNRFQMINIAKSHNKFGDVDEVMRTLARVSVSIPDGGYISSRLERALNAEISFPNNEIKMYHA